jgi:hypothetical protein
VQPARRRGATWAATGCSGCTRTVQGTVHKPSAAPARADEAPALDGQDGGPVGEFFTALGPGWRLTAAQQTRLAPAVTAALDAGWTPRTLAAIAGANTSGVRNPYAVLAARRGPCRTGRPGPR